MLAAIVPVATEVALTEPVVTVEVMYLELGVPPKTGPTMASATAPTPTTIIAIAANLIFIRQCLSRLGRTACTPAGPGGCSTQMYGPIP